MRKRSPLILPTLLIPALLLTGCGEGGEGSRGESQDTVAEAQAAAHAYTDITVDQLRDMMANDDFTLVNVHIPFEGDIPGTDVSIPFDEVSEHLDRLPQDRDAPIVLYCRSDRMSHEAAATLANLGFTNLYNLDGGFRAWTAAGYELELEEGA
ncbi:MAG: rhodanese-like domain-containing protein [Gemmatimonadota bacterium]